MGKLSPHYRSDSISGLLESEIAEYLDEHYAKQLKNLNHQNPKLPVVFSGGNAMGKTTIARKIEAELHGLVLENDAVKRQLLKRMWDVITTKPESESSIRLRWRHLNVAPANLAQQ